MVRQVALHRQLIGSQAPRDLLVVAHRIEPVPCKYVYCTEQNQIPICLLQPAGFTHALSGLTPDDAVDDLVEAVAQAATDPTCEYSGKSTLSPKLFSSASSSCERALGRPRVVRAVRRSRPSPSSPRWRSW